MHDAKIVPWTQLAFKRVGLHYIAFFKGALEPKELASPKPAKITETARSVMNLG